MSSNKPEHFATVDWALLLFTSLIWGSSFLFIRVAVEDMQPGVMAVVRLALGVATLGLFPAARRSVPWSAWPRIVAVGVTWMALPFVLFPIAERALDSAVAGMINASVPIWVALIASIVARRLPGSKQQLGLAIGLAGVVVVSLPSLAGAKATAIGVALVTLAAFCYGVAMNLTAPLTKQYGALAMIWRAQIAALVLLAPVGLTGLHTSTISTRSALAIAALGVLGTGVAFAMFMTLASRVGATRSSITAYLMPLVAMVMGALFQHEALGAAAIIGTVLILAGAYLVSRAEKPVVQKMPLAKAAAIALVVLSAKGLVLSAQQPARVSIARSNAALALPRLTAGKITVDGVGDDAAWQTVPALPLTQYLPIYGSAPVERTEVRVAYDAAALYVMIDAWESHPGSMRASSMIRDDDAPGDFVNVIIDPFGDRKNAVNFSTTPGGGRLDWTIINDAADVASLSPGWNGIWDLATRRDDRGWHAEYRIPFSTLRFTAHDGRVEFGLGVNRLTAHIGERVTFPATEPKTGLSLWKPSNLQRVVVEGINPPRSVLLTPYVVAGRNGLRAPDAVASPWSTSDRADMGADLKMALTPNLNLDLTANTDFAEAEVDDQRINLTRFPLLFPERRQFFIEQAGTFAVRTGTNDLLFNSRRVGLTETGQTVRLLGGARVAGRVGEWDAGFFDAQMEHATNLGVARVRRAFGDGSSWLGAMTTSRVASDSSQTAIGVDGELHLAADDYVNFAIATLAGTPGIGVDEGILPRGAVRIQEERRRNRGLFYRGGVATTGARYAPALGYVERSDAIRPSGQIGYGRVISGAGHVLRTAARGDFLYRNADAAFDASQVAAMLELELPSGAMATMDVTQQDDALLSPFSPTPETSVPSGRYTARSVSLGFTPSTGPRAVMGAQLIGGEYYDGTRWSALLTPEWRASAHLRMGADLQLDRLDFPDRNQREWSKLMRVRVLAAASPKLMLTTVVQASSVAKLGQLNARLRYNVSEGHDLWIVYGHLQNLYRDRFTPTAPATARAGLLIKYTQTFGS